MENKINSKRPNISIELQRAELLRKQIDIEGERKEEKETRKGLVIKEIREGSLAIVNRKFAINNSFIAELEDSLKGVDRKAFKQKAMEFI